MPSAFLLEDRRLVRDVVIVVPSSVMDEYSSTGELAPAVFIPPT